MCRQQQRIVINIYLQSFCKLAKVLQVVAVFVFKFKQGKNAGAIKDIKRGWLLVYAFCTSSPGNWLNCFLKARIKLEVLA